MASLKSKRSKNNISNTSVNNAANTASNDSNNVIDSTADYVSGDSALSSSSHKFQGKDKKISK